jgi:hydroxyacylglutathione hydrolase
MSEIVCLSLAPGRLLNTYLLRDRKTILIDTGIPKSGQRILRMMARAGIRKEDISLILLTHGHIDHAGSALELRRLLGAPVAISSVDAPLLESGINHLPLPITPMGSVIRFALGKNPTFPSVVPDLLLDENSDLEPYGVSAKLLPFPDTRRE